MEIHIFDEFYIKGMHSIDIIREVKRRISQRSNMGRWSRGQTYFKIETDGLPRIKKAKEPSGSILDGIDYLLGFKMYVHPRCVNTITELSTYSWKSDKYDKLRQMCLSTTTIT